MLRAQEVCCTTVQSSAEVRMQASCHSMQYAASAITLSRAHGVRNSRTTRGSGSLLTSRHSSPCSRPLFPSSVQDLIPGQGSAEPPFPRAAEVVRTRRQNAPLGGAHAPVSWSARQVGAAGQAREHALGQQAASSRNARYIRSQRPARACGPNCKRRDVRDWLAGGCRGSNGLLLAELGLPDTSAIVRTRFRRRGNHCPAFSSRKPTYSQPLMFANCAPII